MGNDDISLAWEEPDELGSLVDAWSAKVEDLRPLIEGAKADAEQWRKLPQHIADALRDAGFYRVFTPRSLGGYELHPRVVLKIVEDLSSIDASVAWSMMASANSAILAARMEPAGAEEVFGPADSIVAGSLHPHGTAIEVPGGYCLTGQWHFASGCHNANWLIAEELSKYI